MQILTKIKVYKSAKCSIFFSKHTVLNYSKYEDLMRLCNSLPTIDRVPTTKMDTDDHQTSEPVMLPRPGLLTQDTPTLMGILTLGNKLCLFSKYKRRSFLSVSAVFLIKNIVSLLDIPSTGGTGRSLLSTVLHIVMDEIVK